MKVFTLEEVDKEGHLVIGDKVVNVATFAGIHPGGEGLITGLKGRDATAEYRRAQHSPKADGIVERLTVGLVEKDPLKGIFTIEDMTREGRLALKDSARLYYDAGAEDGQSVREAISAWGDGYWLVPKVLVDVSATDLSCKVPGGVLKLPILAAPTALLRMGHPEGECAVAKGCFQAGAGNCLSTTASVSLEEVAQASPDCVRWFQLYAYRDKGITSRLISRAEKAGYSAIVVTVDLPVLGNRTELERAGFKVPKEFKMANMVTETRQETKQSGDRKEYVKRLYDQSLTRGLLEWVASLTKLPLIVKGVLSVESALVAASLPFVQGVIVSNHGGRQLNGAIPPALALPGIAAAVAEANKQRAASHLQPVMLYVDGGIRRGTDIFKALALGAHAILLGRPIIYGMAVAGAKGVEKTLSILEAELTNCMQLCGAQTLADITPDMVTRKWASKF